MADKEKLTISVEGETSGFKESLTSIGKKITGLSSKLKNVAKASGKAFAGIAKASAAGFTAISGAIGTAIKFYKEQEQAETRTRQTIAATGKAAGLSAEEIFKMASSLQKVTTFGDETIIKGQNLLLTFKNIGKDTFPRATEAMLDMSTAMEVGVKEASIQLGKALNDPMKGISALTRVGITFTDEQKNQIKAMQDSGDVAGAQAVILGELESQFGGVARAAAGGTGKIKQIVNAAGDIAEVFGKAAMPAVTFLAKELGKLIEQGQNSSSMFETFSQVVQVFTGGLLQTKRVVQVLGLAIGSILGTAVESVLQVMEGKFKQAFITIKSSGEEFYKDLGKINEDFNESKKSLDEEFNAANQERYKQANEKEIEAANEKREKLKEIQEQQNEELNEARQAEFETKLAKIEEDQALLDEIELQKYQEKLAKKQEIEQINRAKELEKKGKHDQAMLALEKIKNKKLITESKEKIKKEKEMEQQKRDIEKVSLQATQNFLNVGAQLAKEGSKTQKALLTTNALISTYTAANQALATPPGPPYTIPLMASVIAMGLVNVAKINGAKLAKGGVYTGGIPGVDSIPAVVQRGEITAPVESFDEVIGSVRAKREADKLGSTNESGGQLRVSFDTEEAANMLTIQDNENSALGISRSITNAA